MSKIAKRTAPHTARSLVVAGAGIALAVTGTAGAASAAGHAEAPGKAPSKAAWVSPVHGKAKFTAGFNQGGARWAHKHSGQDFAVQTGTKVHAVHTGTVVEADWGGAYGNNIVIKHGNGLYTQYAHLSKFDVKVGEKVNTDEVIARSGNTGNTSGPHLHFEVRKTPYYGSAVSPIPFLKDKGVKF
jgi:murein DD-endopeptidase MepM/ murein hydrolase activator NlpD